MFLPDWFTARITTLVICLIAVTPVGAADDYLSVLEAEADDTGSRAVDEAGTVPVATAPRVRSVTDNRFIPEGLDFEAFEAELDANYSGTWFLYVKLSAKQRKAVFQTYRKDNSSAAVREEVVRQLASG